jgi:hypothetical protein
VSRLRDAAPSGLRIRLGWFGSAGASGMRAALAAKR